MIQATSRRTDPSFPAPITAALWPSETDGDYALVWSRQKRDA
ncbi:DUF736 family protein [Rhizobium sp. PP-CC-3G-465]